MCQENCVMHTKIFSHVDTCGAVSLDDFKPKCGLFTITGTREVERSAPSRAESLHYSRFHPQDALQQ